MKKKVNGNKVEGICFHPEIQLMSIGGNGANGFRLDRIFRV